VTLVLGLIICLGWATLPAAAQAGGAIEGTVTDSVGAVIPNATVTATNVSTGVSTSRTTTSAGFYSITLLIPGKYTVTVSAAGFETFKQENFIIDNEHVSGLNAILRVGSQNETITVTDTPPALETTNASLGGLVRSDVITELPIMLLTGGASAQQRDITAFSNLLPGAQVPAGGRLSQFNGMPQRTAEIYVDGLPLTIASAQADNRVVYNVVPLESIGEVQSMNSGYTSEYQGAGFLGLSTSSGGSQYHGAIYGLIRNTLFDAWTFAGKCGTPGQPLDAAHTGCGNRRILDNLALLVRTAPNRVQVRIPLVPGITSTRENLARLAVCLRERGVRSAILLPYNPLGGQMAMRLGHPRPPIPEGFMGKEEQSVTIALFESLVGQCASANSC